MKSRQSGSDRRGALAAVLATAFAGLAGLPAPGHAQQYPSKSIRLIIPHPPGGTSDLIGRTLARKMGESMGQQVVVENRPGGSTMVAAAALAASPADGYSLMVHIGQLYTNPMMYKKVTYKVEDFIPISLAAIVPYSLSVNRSLPVKTPKDLVDYIRANPGRISYATLGAGGNTHLIGKLLEEITGVRMTDVPYKGSAQAMTDLIGGQVQLYFDAVATSIPQYRNGRITIVGVTSAQRLPGAPDIPTLKEQGMDLVGDTWWGIFAPAGTPRPIVERIHAEVVRAVASPEYVSALTPGGGIAVSSKSPEDFVGFIKAETEKWGKVIRPLGLQLD